jgi:SAM-dependent methyltransferase
MIKDGLISERYRFREDYIPSNLSKRQREACGVFLEKIHRKREYVYVDKCPYCGHDSFIKISETSAKGLPADIVICSSCDGCFKYNVMNPQANRFHYENISYALRGKETTDAAIEKLFNFRVKTFAYPRYRFISQFLNLKPGRDLIVEFGCNDGANLFPWRQKGFDVLGIDFDPIVVEFGRCKGLDMVSGDFIDYDFAGRRPALIIMTHVIEHVTDVNQLMSRLHDVLAPDGRLFLEAPGTMAGSLENFLACIDVEHNYYFDEATLNRLAHRHRFENIYSDEYISALYAPVESGIREAKNPVSFSLGGVGRGLAAAAASFVLGRMRDKKLAGLLRAADRREIGVRVFNKLNYLHYRNYHSSMSVDKAGSDDETGNK